LLSVALLSVATDGSPTNPQSVHWFYTGFLDARDISHSVKEIFDNYIRNNMECGDDNLQRCKENLTSLRLTTLPEKRKLNANTFDNEWKGIVESQVRGIRVFAKILSDLVEHDKQVFDGRVGERKQLNKLEEIANDLENMIEPLADKLEEEYCVTAPVDLATEAPCEICKRPHLPSKHLEVVRNYQFLKQLTDFVDQFKKTLFVLAWKQPKKETRCPQ